MMKLTRGDVVANRFAIDIMAGSGGMGTVYRARDKRSGDFVALKLLNAPRTDGADSERFAREAQILSELQHPGIVSYVAHGQTPQGLRFLAMQWLEGEDLAQRLSRGALILREALLLIQSVAEALVFAHAHGVLHRDLKPTNLFLPDGDISHVKILDFGIARRLATSHAMTRTGMIVGTPEYMAPEQARAVRELTPAADMFSLGCVFYECLVGEPPFAGEHVAAVLMRILFEEPPPIAQRWPGLPESVCGLLARLLIKDPAQRIGSAGELAAALRAIGVLGGLPLSPALAAPIRMTRAQLDSEQMLLSLVLALSSSDTEVGGRTVPASDAVAEQQRHGPLLAELRAIGAQADLLLGGALVVTVARLASAQDQAAQAAHYAALIKERWPEAQVVVVTGRGSLSRGGLTGEVLDRAWRLLGLRSSAPATPRDSSTQILIDHVSAGLLETRFDVERLPALEGGFALGSERQDADAGRLLLGKPTPCLGRERELSTLEVVYNECKEDLVARAVLVLGPPGLGKSRLRHEFVRRLESRGAQGIVLMGRGDPMKVKSAYGILGEALRKRWDVREGQEPAEQRARIRARIAAKLPASEALRVTVFLGEVCGVVFPDEESPQLRAARQDPRIMSDQVERAWLDGLQLLHTEEPLLVILEDLHWSDAPTIKLIETALRRLRNQSFMVLALARPEVNELYPNLWKGAMLEMPLHPLPRKAGERLVRQILGPEVTSAQIAQLVEQSAGNPLFLEELIRAAAGGKTGALPETIVAMIQARIGRLPIGARRALRAASVCGETFWENGIISLLAATHGAERVHGTLEDLVRDEIIEWIPAGRFANESQYHFRHALVRDAAYGLVSEEEKVAWHAAAGTFLEGAGEREAILLADHYRFGQELSRAIRCYKRAAEQASDAANVQAALACIDRGLACGAIGEDRGELLSLQCLINNWREQYDQILTSGREALALLRPGTKSSCQVLFPLALATAYRDPSKMPELVSSFLRIEPQAEALPLYCSVLTGLAIFYITVGQKAASSLLRQHAHRFSQGLTDQDHNAWSLHFMMEATHSHLGVYLPHTCTMHFRKAIQEAQQAGNRQQHSLAASLLSGALADLGQRADALPMLRSNVLLAEQMNDSYPLGFARAYLACWLAESVNPDDWEESKRHILLVTQTKNARLHAMAHGALAQIARAGGELGTAESEAQTSYQFHAKYPAHQANSAALWARILRQQGKAAEALKICEGAVQQTNTLGIEPFGLLALYVELAEARERMGQHEVAHDTIVSALPILKRCLDDIPDSPMRAAYLREVPENARLLELCRQWGIDASSLHRGG